MDGAHTLYEGEFEEGRLHGYGRQLNSLLHFEREYEVRVREGKGLMASSAFSDLFGVLYAG